MDAFRTLSLRTAPLAVVLSLVMIGATACGQEEFAVGKCTNASASTPEPFKGDYRVVDCSDPEAKSKIIRESGSDAEDPADRTVGCEVAVSDPEDDRDVAFCLEPY
jgi:hypothetical protein